jgi:Ca2+/Na+ antiporter
MVVSPYAAAILALIGAANAAESCPVNDPEPDICCKGTTSGQIFPLFKDDEAEWPKALRGFLYALGTAWMFFGVAIIADLFMAAIEEITSKIYLHTDKTGKRRVHRFWNSTVANLSLMALGSSAPEIMLNVQEVVVLDFHVGPLGTSTIVGSAAFNLLVITAVVVSAITGGEVKKIETLQVYFLTASVSVFAYIWMLIILLFASPGIITLAEALLTFSFFWILLVAAYLCDRKCFMQGAKKIAPMSKTVGDMSTALPPSTSSDKAASAITTGDGQLDGMTVEQKQKLALQSIELQPPTYAGASRNAMAWLTGKKAKPVYRKLKAMASVKGLTEGLTGVAAASLKRIGGSSGEVKDHQVVKFNEEAVDVLENAGSVIVTIEREGGDLETSITVELRSHDISATAGKDYEAVEETVAFAKGEATKQVKIKIIDDDTWEKSENFRVELSSPSGGAKLDDRATTCVVQILNDDHLKENANKLLQKLGNRDKMHVVMTAWKEQFVDAIHLPKDDGDDADAKPGLQVWAVHIFVVFWKVVFATVPPVRLGGGWPAFWVSLIYIGGMTIFVSDLCGLFGCVLGCPPAITAITFVALGTSMPDMFASKGSAEQDESADNSIGNITGSNCVNVFLGLGLPWTISAVYWACASEEETDKWKIKYENNTDVKKWIRDGGGAAFVVPAGDLGLSVIVFCCCAATCLLTLGARRILYGGELGGPAGTRTASSIFFVALWVLYVTISSLKSTGKIEFNI